MLIHDRSDRDKEADTVLMARKGRTTKVSVEVTPNTSRRLKILAAERGVTVTYLLTAMIERELAEAEQETQREEGGR